MSKIIQKLFNITKILQKNMFDIMKVHCMCFLDINVYCGTITDTYIILMAFCKSVQHACVQSQFVINLYWEQFFVFLTFYTFVIYFNFQLEQREFVECPHPMKFRCTLYKPQNFVFILFPILEIIEADIPKIFMPIVMRCLLISH